MSKTINLLPEKNRTVLRYESVLHGLIKAMWISLLGFCLVGLTQLGTRLYLQHKAEVVRAEISALRKDMNKEDNAAIKTKVVAVNNIVKDFTSLGANSPKWSRVLKAFAVLPPPGVRVNSFQVDSKAKKVLISGSAPAREDVIALYNNIRADSREFYGIDYPLENVARPKNVQFHFSFFVKDELLR